jgi:succinoglycan biosynthesis transport protein ExoP
VRFHLNNDASKSAVGPTEIVSLRNGPPAPELDAAVVAEVSEAGYLSFENVLGVLWRHRKTVALCMIAGFSVAGALYAIHPKMYQASATLEIQLPNDDYLNHRQFSPSQEPGAILIEPYHQTQLRLLQSDAIVLRAAAKVDLIHQREFLPNAHWWRRLVPSTPQAPELAKGPFLEVLHDRLDARMLGNTEIVEITFEAEDAKLAARFVNTLADEYGALSVNRQADTLHQTGDLLRGQIVEARRALLEAQKRLQDYVSTSGLLSGGDKDSVAEQRLKQLQGALTAAEDARIADSARYLTARAAVDRGANELLENESLKTYRLRMTELRQQLAEASQIYLPQHFKVRQLQAELGEVEQAYQREREAALQRLKNQFEGSQAREQELLAEYTQQVDRTARQMTDSVRYSTLKSDVDTQQQLYNSLVQRTEEAALASAIRTSNVKVVGLADVPYKPIRPQKTLYAALGLGLGAVPALLISFGRERRQRRGAAQSANVPLGLVTLGVIPGFKPSAKFEIPELASWTSPESTFSRVIEGASHFLAPRGTKLGVIGTTSPDNGAGKTTVACNLAVQVARSGRCVLLIDANPDRPKLHEIFDLNVDMEGFSDWAGGDTNSGLASAWVTRIPNLTVMAWGARRFTSARRYVEIVEAVRSEFDLVIFDLPAVLQTPGAASLAACLDRVAVVINSRNTMPEEAELAIRQLAVARASVAGVLYNDVSRPASLRRLTNATRV